MTGMSLLDVLRGVMLDPAEQAAYNADPRAYLAQFGFGDVDPADLSEAVGLVADTLPPDQAQAALSSTVTGTDSSFGDVTADFDAEPGGAPAAPAGGDDPGPAGDEPTVDDDVGGDDVTALSFGEGGDLDDDTFEDAADDGADLGGHDLADVGQDHAAHDVDDDLGHADDHDLDHVLGHHLGDHDVDNGLDHHPADVAGPADDPDTADVLRHHLGDAHADYGLDHHRADGRAGGLHHPHDGPGLHTDDVDDDLASGDPDDSDIGSF